MITLSNLLNSDRPKKKVQRVGRGIGSRRGKTCCRGHKGDKARSGYKRRYGHEGGQLPLYRKVPARGFSNARFSNFVEPINFGLLNRVFEDGDVVNAETLKEKGLLRRKGNSFFKILATGKLTKKLRFEDVKFSHTAREQIDKSASSTN